MRELLFASLAVYFLQLSIAHADPKFIRFQRAVRAEAIRHGLLIPSELAPEALQLDQIIDHFATPGTPEAQATFKQNYFFDDTYAKGPDSPVVLYLCGEGACEGATSAELVNEVAQKYGAYRVALEHRYYGTSQPFANLETQNLKYLSMDQAIEDLAYFEKFLKATHNLTGKWIVVGGSYAGELSAFYRMKHPELVAGSLASSGPVLSKADFFEYDQHNAQVVSAVCLTAIKAVVSDVEGKLKDPAASAQVKALFNATALTNDVDFLYIIADMGATAIQYGYQEQFCNAITNPGSQTTTEAYAAFGNKIFSAFGTDAVQDWIQGAMDTSISAYSSGVGMRGWMYQSCTEFGYYQIANPDPTWAARSQQITLAYHNDACKRLFGITTPVNVDVTNHKFFDHLADAATTNIFFTNGSEDPYSTLSLTDTSETAKANPGLKFFLISGGAHCDDLGSRMSDALTSARTEFETLVGDWLVSN